MIFGATTLSKTPLSIRTSGIIDLIVTLNIIYESNDSDCHNIVIPIVVMLSVVGPFFVTDCLKSNAKWNSTL
jgi:hypothetical protein